LKLAGSIDGLMTIRNVRCLIDVHGSIFPMGREHLISIWRRGLTRFGLDRHSAATIEGVSAVTLATHNMACAVAFTACWDLRSFRMVMTRRLQAFGLGRAFSILSHNLRSESGLGWGRVIFYPLDVDSLYASVIAAGRGPDTASRDTEWGERFFHLTNPDGHELSFAWPLR
jgi:hypothetical protein